MIFKEDNKYKLKHRIVKYYKQEQEQYGVVLNLKQEKNEKTSYLIIKNIKTFINENHQYSQKNKNNYLFSLYLPILNNSELLIIYILQNLSIFKKQQFVQTLIKKIILKQFFQGTAKSSSNAKINKLCIQMQQQIKQSFQCNICKLRLHVLQSLICFTCKNPFHLHCLIRPINNNIQINQLLCNQCQPCSICYSKAGYKLWKKCISCCSIYHQQCLKQEQRQGSLICFKCIKCALCKKKMNNLFDYFYKEGKTYCQECMKILDSKQFCIVCSKIQKDKKLQMWVLCDQCNSWVHFKCDPVLNDQSIKKHLKEKSYICPSCRKVKVRKYYLHCIQTLVKYFKIIRFDQFSYFLKPNYEQLFNYKKVINQPMDFQKMKQNAKKGQYDQQPVKKIQQHFSLIIQNAINYNMPKQFPNIQARKMKAFKGILFSFYEKVLNFSQKDILLNNLIDQNTLFKKEQQFFKYIHKNYLQILLNHGQNYLLVRVNRKEEPLFIYSHLFSSKLIMQEIQKGSQIMLQLNKEQFKKKHRIIIPQIKLIKKNIINEKIKYVKSKNIFDNQIYFKQIVKLSNEEFIQNKNKDQIRIAFIKQIIKEFQIVRYSQILQTKISQYLGSQINPYTGYFFFRHYKDLIMKIMPDLDFISKLSQILYKIQNVARQKMNNLKYNGSINFQTKQQLHLINMTNQLKKIYEIKSFRQKYYQLNFQQFYNIEKYKSLNPQIGIISVKLTPFNLQRKSQLNKINLLKKMINKKIFYYFEIYLRQFFIVKQLKSNNKLICKKYKQIENVTYLFNQLISQECFKIKILKTLSKYNSFIIRINRTNNKLLFDINYLKSEQQLTNNDMSKNMKQYTSINEIEEAIKEYDPHFRIQQIKKYLGLYFLQNNNNELSQPIYRTIIEINSKKVNPFDRKKQIIFNRKNMKFQCKKNIFFFKNQSKNFDLPKKSQSLNFKLDQLVKQLTFNFTQQQVTVPSKQIKNLQQLKQAKIIVGPSNIDNIGMFSLENLDQYTFVIQYKGQLIRQDIADARQNTLKILGYNSCYMFALQNKNKINNQVSIIDATFVGNEARYLNHSCNVRNNDQPNCNAESMMIKGERKIIIYTMRPVKKFQQLTYDYKFNPQAQKLHCSCKSKYCQGRLN